MSSKRKNCENWHEKVVILKRVELCQIVISYKKMTFHNFFVNIFIYIAVKIAPNNDVMTIITT